MAHYPKSLISTFQEFLLELKKFSIWQKDCTLGYHSKSYVVRQLVRQLVYTMFISSNRASFTCGERKIW